jgi:hypothetical protein
MKNKVEFNILQIIIIHIEMKIITNANVLQTSESRVRQSQQNVLILEELAWSRSNQGAYQEPKPTPNCYRFYKHEGHAFINCPFIKKNVQDAMINHFQIKMQMKWNLKEGHNPMIIQQNIANPI